MLWGAVSMFERREQARSLAQKLPKLGDSIAAVRLEPDAGISLASWGSPGHTSVWGPPDRLVESVIEVVAVDG